MKTLKTPLVLASTLIVVTFFLSWTLLDDYGATSTTSSSLLHKDKPDAATYVFTKDNISSPQPNDPPAAEDVLVQRIPGDNGHLLIMAYYSKENYSGAPFTIESGFTITFSDDGRGDDKVAGDGFYTAKIPSDAAAFRNQAISMLQKMKAGKYAPFRYLDRQRIVDPDAAESFKIAKFDAYQPVSVSGLTNALSADFRPLTVQTSKPASSTTNGAVAASTSLNATAALTSTTLLDSIKQNSILITNLKVVEDSTRTWNYCTQKGNVNGTWTFGTLMRELASKSPTQKATDAAVSAYIKNWLSNWERSQTINGDNVAARTLIDSLVLTPWLTKSQNAGAPAGQLNMKFAPFKLMAIVNRFDNRNSTANGGIFKSTFGEGRFVFCLISSNCSGPLQFTVIFEYRVHLPNTLANNTCSAKHTWAQEWINLKNFTLGSASYNQALQKITDQFTKCGTNTSRPNQSSLNALRTNEIALVLPTSINPKRWELREFTLDNSTGNLKETTIGQNPADKYDAQVVNADVQRMVNYVNQNQTKIIAGTDTLPLTWQGVPFLAGAVRVNGTPTGQLPNAFHWDGTGSGNSSTFITNDKSRYYFSLESCVGCHAGETQTAFTHINPVFFGSEAKLSGFLSGTAGSGGAIDFDSDANNGVMSVKDAAMRPSGNPLIRTFNDIDRRARDLLNFVSTSCGSTLAISSQLMFQPTNMVH